ncbi:MAG TPA: hypothetical protein VIJ34_06655 [Acidimicrobiales bacterium]
MTRSRTIAESADLVGRERYAELTLFAALGHRVLTASVPAIAVLLASAAEGHVWRAKVLEELLPVSLGLPGVDDATRSAGPEFDAAVVRLASESDDVSLAEALAKVLYPQMLSAYRAHLVGCSEVSDPPVMLALRRVIADLESQSDELYTAVGADDGTPRGSAAAVLELLEHLSGPFGQID